MWHIIEKQKYSSGRRGAPAKGIGRVTGARVQIPPSAFDIYIKILNWCLKIKFKKLLTNENKYDRISKFVTKLKQGNEKIKEKSCWQTTEYLIK